ncbi:MAG: methyltransferase domain-containing protein [Planctomycetes bacterium]|nr:methyltransferase domain-containing protein [Planctomycetota bacterium]
MSFIQSLSAVENPMSLSNRMRTKRFELFERLAANMPRPLRIIDLGGTPEFWEQRGWGERSDVHITGVNIQPKVTGTNNFQPVFGDVTDLSQFPDNSFDIAFSNSVIEHLRDLQSQAKMACEMKRVAGAIWLQTPNYWFPIEPHFHIVGWQWLPIWLRKAIIKKTRCGWRGPCRDEAEAEDIVREVRLMTKRELVKLFPDHIFVAERFCGVVKSWIVHSGFFNQMEIRKAA